MSPAQGSNPSLVQADTLFAAETPPSRVDTGGEDLVAIFDDPRYTGGALLGQGGMGEVRLLRDRRLGREVAVKVLKAAPGSIGSGRRRFLREARVQGQLEHPSVVPVYDLEVSPDGEARITMKRVRGQTLEAVLHGLASGDAALGRRFSRRRLLTAFVSVCRALDYAHARGVIHRDVKPANVMLGDFGEVHLLDWGIARIQGATDADVADSALPAVEGPAGEAGETAAGTVLGTPGYMSPEQVRGETSRLDARSDVFALGAVLFEILTLTPMLPGTVRERLLATLAAKGPRSPAAEAPGADIAPELSAAVLAATEPRPEDRCASAGALAEAVDRYLDGDRDLAARRALAGEEVERAKELLRAAADPAEEAESRARAVRILARAIALDPHCQEASDRLGELLVETPRELPREAAVELAAARRRAASTAAGLGLFRLVGVFLLGALGIVMGVRKAWLGTFGISALLFATVMNLLWMRVATDRAREILRAATLLSSVAALTTLSYVFGPSILVPALAMLNGFILLGQADFRSVRVVIAVSLVPVLWRFGLGALGLAEMPYAVRFDDIVIGASLVSFPATLTLALLAGVGALQVVAPLALVAALRERLRSMEERLFLHSHHLRTLASSSRADTRS